MIAESAAGVSRPCQLEKENERLWTKCVVPEPSSGDEVLYVCPTKVSKTRSDVARTKVSQMDVSW